MAAHPFLSESALFRIPGGLVYAPSVASITDVQIESISTTEDNLTLRWSITLSGGETAYEFVYNLKLEGVVTLYHKIVNSDGGSSNIVNGQTIRELYQAGIVNELANTYPIVRHIVDLNEKVQHEWASALNRYDKIRQKISA